MAVPHPTSPVLGRPRPLLVGPGGDVVLVDVAGFDAHQAAGRIVAVHGASQPALAAAARGGALVAVPAVQGQPDLAGAGALVEAGVPAGQVLVEVPFGPGTLPEAALHAVAAAGLPAVVLLVAPDGDRDAAAGWEIGALTQVLGVPGLAVAAIRGTSPERFRRVAAVVAAIADAAEPQGEPA